MRLGEIRFNEIIIKMEMGDVIEILDFLIFS